MVVIKVQYAAYGNPWFMAQIRVAGPCDSWPSSCLASRLTKNRYFFGRLFILMQSYKQHRCWGMTIHIRLSVCTMRSVFLWQNSLISGFTIKKDFFLRFTLIEMCVHICIKIYIFKTVLYLYIAQFNQCDKTKQCDTLLNMIYYILNIFN